MVHSLVRFKEVVAGGWGQPYRFDRVQIHFDEVVEVDPNQYRRQTNQKLGLIGPDPTPEMKAALLRKGLLTWPVTGTSDVVHIGPRGGRVSGCPGHFTENITPSHFLFFNCLEKRDGTGGTHHLFLHP